MSASNCFSLTECSSTLDFVSLGMLLIEASYPEELRESGSLEERTLSQWTTFYRVNSILRMADTNGDDYLSVVEALSALDQASLTVPSALLKNAVVWASPGANPTSDYTGWAKSYNSSSIGTMVTEAVAQFILTETFYGYAGSSMTPTAMESVLATYPDSTWSAQSCLDKLDMGVTLTWAFKTGSASLYQQCGYVNGKLCVVSLSF